MKPRPIVAIALAFIAAILAPNPAEANVSSSDLPTVTFATAVERTETDTGAGFVRVYFNLTAPAVDIGDTGWGSVDIDFVDGTATSSPGAGQDYRPSSRKTVRWGPGVISRWVDFRIVGDRVFEPDETLSIQLSNPDKVQLVNTEMVVTILNNDPEPFIPTVTIEPADANGVIEIGEGDARVKNNRLTVKLDAPAPTRVEVLVATDDSGSAEAGIDYRTKRQKLVFQKNQTQRIFTVQTFGDSTFGVDRDFFIDIVAADGSTVLHTQQVIIADDDEPGPELINVANGFATVTEGDAGYQTIRLEFILDGPAPRNSSVRVWFGDSSDSATAGRDYVPLRNRLVRFRTGEATAFVNVRIRGDRVAESTETVDVYVSNARGVSIPGVDWSSFVTIIDND